MSRLRASRLHIVAPQADALARAVRERVAGIEVVPASTFDTLGDEAVAGIEALVGFPATIDQALLGRLTSLRWIQTLPADMDPLTSLELNGAVVSAMGGVQGPQMAEHAFLLLLALRRDLRGLLRQQAAHRWIPGPRPLIAGSRLLIVGVGRIAEVVAQRARAFDMAVVGVSGSRREAPGFDRIVPVASLAKAAAAADHLLVLAPYSERTHHLVSREVTAALPDHAVVLNIARGPVVDEAALIEALAGGHIAGAGLDVFEREPLPAESPLWDLPNVIVTPHIGGWSTAFVEQVSPIIAVNAMRWFGGQRPLLNEQA